MILGISLVAVLMTVFPIYAASMVSTINTNARGDRAHSLLTRKDMPLSSYNSAPCDTASQDANSGPPTNSGNIQPPFGIGSIVYFSDPNLTVNAPGIPVLWAGSVAVVDAFIIAII